MVEKVIRILLVDDHQLFREGMKRILEMEPGMAVIGECGDGEEARRIARELQPDVILLDINMPSLNGVEATPILLKESPRSRVIILSIHDDENYVFRTLRNGASGYLLKEMEAESLIDAVRKVADGGAYIHPRVTGKLIDEFRRLSEEEEQLRREMAATAASSVQDEESWKQLTPREREVLQLLAKGKSNRAIAEILFISEKTVKNHVSSILMKLGVDDRTQAVIHALKNGWFSL